MKLAANNRYYPTIDYTKCIFCHFCVDSCPGAALRPTKVHDVVYKNMNEMITSTEEMVKPPKIVREDGYTVEYVIDGVKLILRRIKEKDNLIPEFKPHEKVKEYSACVMPESCLACGICVSSCPSEAINLSVKEKEKELKIDKERCTGCGICVKECPVQILSLVRE
jgi:NADH-quinone oxidoreductase subunit I